MTFSKLFSTTAASTASNTITSYAQSVSIYHWVVGLTMVGTVATVKLAQNTEDKKEKQNLMNLHKSLALIVCALVPFRVVSRLTTLAPAHLPGHRVEQLAGTASHLGLYALMIGLPASGVAMGYFSGFGIPFFGLFKVPGTANPNKAISGPAYKAHKLMGQALTYLVPLHISAAAFHQIRGHQIFQRVNPFKSSQF